MHALIEREVEMLLDRGIVVSYKTIRRWCRKHGPDYARRTRRKAPRKAMSGTSMQSRCASTVRNAGCGEQLIRTDMCSMRSSRRPQHQGGQAPADATSDEAGHAANAYGHRQICAPTGRPNTKSYARGPRSIAAQATGSIIQAGAVMT